MRDTKPNLSNAKFEQPSGDTLTLSGRTEIHGIFEIENGGVLRLDDGNQGVGKVMTSDSTGATSWQDPFVTSAVAPDTSVQFNNSNAFSGSSDFTWDNSAKQLDIVGDIAISGTSFLRAGANDIGSLEIGCNSTTNSSDNGTAIGNNTIASGDTSIGMGHTAHAFGIRSIAIGYQADAYGSCSLSVGAGACSTQSRSVSIGIDTDALGVYSIVLGSASIATGSTSLAIGRSVYAFGGSSVAIANNAKAYSAGGVSIGTGSVASGSTSSIAIGNTASALGSFSTAIGHIAKATYSANIAIGCNTRAYGNNSSISIGQNVISTGDCATVLGQVSCALGLRSIAIGNNACAVGNCTVVLGSAAFAEGVNSTALGFGTQALGGCSIALGCSAYSDSASAIAIGTASDAVGSSTTAIGPTAYACGVGSTSIGSSSASFGQTSIAIGNADACLLNSIGIGSLAVAAGISSIALGSNIISSGSSSVSIGNTSDSWGTASIALGASSQSLANCSIAIGSAGCVTGGASMSIGNNSCVLGACSLVLGAQSIIATGNNSVVIGRLSCTTVNTTVGIGLQNVNTGANSIAIGNNNNLSGICGIGIGQVTTSSGASSIAIGRCPIAGGSNSIAIGSFARNYTANSIVMGLNTTSACECSVAFGWGALQDAPPTIVFAQDGNSYLDGTSQQFAIGHTGATAKLDILDDTACGALRMRDGSESAGYVLTSDGSGYATWCSGITGGVGITNSSNGLTDDGSTVCLGGALTTDTKICIGSNAFSVTGSDSGDVGFGRFYLGVTPGEDLATFQASANDTINLLYIDDDNSYSSQLFFAEGNSGGGSFTLAANASGGTTAGIQFNSGITTGIKVVDTFSCIGFTYDADYSANWTDRSIPDKAYVDSIASGLDAKDSVFLATTTSDGDIDISGGTFVSGSTLDGQVVQDGWRVLIKNQTDAKENGIYDYSASTSGFTRSTDFDGTPSGEVSNGAFMTVVTGDTLINTQWILTTQDPVVIGVSELTFSLLSQQLGITAGDGIAINTVGSNEEISTRLKSGGGLAFDTGEMYVEPVESTQKTVTQSSHGFVVGNAISFSGGTYIKSLMDGTQDSEVFGLVTEVVDLNNFVVTLQGFVDTLSGLVANTTYFVSDATAGLLTATEPTTDGSISKPIVTTTSTTAGLVLPYRGSFISTGGTCINQATNGLTQDATQVKLGGDLCETTTINICSYSLTIGDKPIQYASDYSSQYNALSIPDVGYVTGQTADLSADLAYISGQTDLKLNISDFNVYSGVTASEISQNASDIQLVSGVTTTNTGNIAGNLALINANTADITFLGVFSGDTVADLSYISGQTDLKLNISDFNVYSGVTATDISNNAADIAYITANTVNNGSNLGGGSQVFASKSGTDLQFKTLSGGTDITLSSDSNVITISSDASTLPGGASEDIQYNNGSVFGGSSVFKYTHANCRNLLFGATHSVSTDTNMCFNTLLGQTNGITGNSRYNLIQGASNTMGAGATASAIIGSSNSSMSATNNNVIIGGDFHNVNGTTDNVLIGGTNNCANGFDQIIIGGSATTGVTNSIVLGRSVYICGSVGDGTGEDVLTISSSGKINKVASGGGGTSTLTGNTIVGNDSDTVFTIQHNCATRDMMVQVYEDQTPWGNVLVAVERPNTACITLTFDTAPATGEDYRVLMLT